MKTKRAEIDIKTEFPELHRLLKIKKRSMRHKHKYNKIRVDGIMVFQYRAVMEKAIGRPLKKKEGVHHIDGNKKNDDLDNLWLYRNVSKHRKIHSSFTKLLAELFQKGYVIFNPKNAQYEVSKNIQKC